MLEKIQIGIQNTFSSIYSYDIDLKFVFSTFYAQNEPSFGVLPLEGATYILWLNQKFILIFIMGHYSKKLILRPKIR